MATSNINQVFLQGAIEAFQRIVAPISAFSYAISTQGATLNDTIRVPFVNAATSSADFTYAIGYNIDSTDITGKDVVLNHLKYQRCSLTDADMQKLNADAVLRLGNECGARLAGDVLSCSFAEVITNANFPLSSSYHISAISSSVTLVTLATQADNLNWPTTRNMILNTTAHAHLLNNTAITNAYAYGNGTPAQTGHVPNIFGFAPYKTSVAMATSVMLNPNAILLGMAPHQPAPDADRVVTVEPVTNQSGLVLTLRSWYDPGYATSRKVVECLFGVAVGDSNALVQLKT